MAQKFYASPTDRLQCANGAIGHRPGTTYDCLGPYAKVANCPIEVDGVIVARLTCYATGYADTYFSVPACTRTKGKHVRGYFTQDDDGIVFRVVDSHKHLFTKEQA
jgi:hypothetical protein